MFIEMARTLARQVVRQAQDREQRAGLVFRRVLTREPELDELKALWAQKRQKPG